MGRETTSTADLYLEELTRREDRKRALNSCYMDSDRIADCLEEGLITEEEAREVRRSYLFDGRFYGDYPLELDTALRREDITYEEYCENLKRYYIRRNPPEGEIEGLLDFWDLGAENWDYDYRDDLDECFLWYGPEDWKIKEGKPPEFEIIDYRSPYALSEMQDHEIEAAAYLFHLIEERTSGEEGIDKPLEFLEELTLNGFRVPKSLDKILLEARNHDAEWSGPFEMSKLRFTRFRNKIRRYAATFWFNLFFHRPDIYEDFWEKSETRSRHLIIK
jgi:hypothetical protein